MIPSRFLANERVEFRIESWCVGYDSRRVSSAGFVLEVLAKSKEDGFSGFEVTALDDGAWNVVIPTGALSKKGNYYLQMVAIEDGTGDRYAYCDGLIEFEVLPDLNSLTVFDGRSEDQIELEVVRAQIKKIIEEGVEEFSVPSHNSSDQSETRLDLAKLRAREEQLTQRIFIACNQGNLWVSQVVC